MLLKQFLDYLNYVKNKSTSLSILTAQRYLLELFNLILFNLLKMSIYLDVFLGQL